MIRKMENYRLFSKGIGLYDVARSIPVKLSDKIVELKYIKRDDKDIYDIFSLRSDAPYAQTLPNLMDFNFVAGGSMNYVKKFTKELLDPDNLPLEMRLLRSISDDDFFGLFADTYQISEELNRDYDIDGNIHRDEIKQFGLLVMNDKSVSEIKFDKDITVDDGYVMSHLKKHKGKIGDDEGIIQHLGDYMFLGMGFDLSSVAEVISAEFMVPDNNGCLDPRLTPDSIRVIRSFYENSWGIFRDNSSIIL